jgi:hypothetical protein
MGDLAKRTWRPPRALLALPGPALAAGIAAVVAIAAAAPRAAWAQDCAALSGPARTDCEIAGARLQGAKAAVARDAARVGADVEYLRAATGAGSTARKPRRKKAKRAPKGN